MIFSKSKEYMEKNLKELQEQYIPNVFLEDTNISYSTEYNVFTYYKSGATQCANSTYSTLQEAINKAREWYKAEQDLISYIEISLQISEVDESEEVSCFETVGDTVVAYIRKEE